MLNYLKRIFNYLKMNKYRAIILSFIIIFIIAMVDVFLDFSIIFSQRIVFSILDSNNFSHSTIIKLCIELLLFAICLIFLCLVGDIVLNNIVNKYFFITVYKLFKKIINISHEKIIKYDKDDIIGRLTIESKDCFNLFINGVCQVIYNSTLLVLSIFFLADIQLTLAAIILCLNIFLVFCLRLFDPLISKLKKEFVITLALIRSNVQLVYRNIEIIKLGTKYEKEINNFSNNNKKLLNIFLKLKVIEVFLNKIFPLVTDICRGIILFYLSRMIINDVLQLSDLIFFLTIINRINIPFYGFINARTSIIESRELFTRQEELICMPESTKTYLDYSENDNTLLCFRKASFSFTDNSDVTRNILINNFSIKKNEMICITGENGSGKSTFLLIILGIKQLDVGNIYASNYFKTAKIDFLPHPPAIFESDVEWNILFQNNNCKNSLESVNKYGIKELQKNYSNDEYICNKLSGGEKAKIVFARSVIYDADIVIFDEPEAWLDKTQKNFLIERIKELHNNRTLIIVTHDNDILSMCKKIVKIENNMVVCND